MAKSKSPKLLALLAGLNEISLVVIGAVKDGIQLKDVESIYKTYKASPELQEKVDAAFHAVKDGGLGTEFKAIDLSAGIELLSLQLNYIPMIKEALKKEVVAEAVALEATTESAPAAAQASTKA